jgi:hypothetical protein
MGNNNRLIAFSLGIAMVLAPGAQALAQDNTVGQEAYKVSCAVCHGSDGQGGGEFADVLSVPVPDLTRLTANTSDKVFPYLRVFQTVDGRASIRAHGTAEMPIWGDTFRRRIGEEAGPFGSELLIRAKIVALVDYIESLQRD